MKHIFKHVLRYGAFALVVAILFLIIQGMVTGNALLSFGSAADTKTTSTRDEQANSALPAREIQKVKLSMDGYTYILNPSVLQEGVPVEMEVDLDTVTGCMRDIVIRDFGVHQYVEEGKNIIRFTPTKAGTITIACSMQMGRGTFTVVKFGGAIIEK